MSDTPAPAKWYKKPKFIIIIIILVSCYLLFKFLSKKLSFLNNTDVVYLIFLLGSILIPIVAVLLVVWLVVRQQKKPAKTNTTPKMHPEEYRMKYQEILLWHKLGSTKEEREKNIQKMFDNKTETVYYGTRMEFTDTTDDGYKMNTYIQFCISRNLASMEQKEREFLRTTFLLYNNGLLSENQWNYYRFAFINGNGKAPIDDYNYYVYNRSRTQIKDGITTIKWYQDKIDGSVDSAINGLLRKIETIGQDSTLENVKHIKKIKNRLHGDGSWLAEDEIAETIFNGGGEYQLNLGMIEDSNTILHFSGEGSLITIAPPGSGKTQCFVVPNMLNWKGAAVVLDIKGEIYEATHKWREKNVGRVFKFSPMSPNTSNSYNPLTFIRQDADYIWEDSRFLADMMIVPSGASDPYWENMARDVVTATISYICFNNEPEDRAMTKVIDIIYGIGWDEMITALKTNVFVGAMRQTGHSLESIEHKQRDSILKTAQSSLSAWQGERIARVTTKSDWSPLDLRNGTPTIYICINPNEIDSYLSVLRVFIAQHIRMLTSELPQRGTAPVLFMLDELPRLKRMAPVDEALHIGRQYSIKLWLFAQSYGQLKEAYPDSEGLMGSCVVRTFMNLPLSEELTTKISDQLGYRHDALGNTKEKLVEPLELAGPNYRDLILVLATNTKPVKLVKQYAYESEELKKKQLNQNI